MLLELGDLEVTYRLPDREVQAVRGVDLDLLAGRTLGVVGESGCGKSTLVRTVLGLLPANARTEGSLRLDGQDLLGASEQVWGRVRGRRIGFVPQGAMSGLNPVHRVGAQIAETLVLHRGRSRSEARTEAPGWLERVGLPARRARDFPHEFSGGMRQRVVIAMTLAARPDLIVADEPTTGLDQVVQTQILDLLAGLARDSGAALILVSHDLPAIAPRCDDLAVMYAGEVVERGPTGQLVAAPRHPYSAGLLAASPRLDRAWAQIPGPTPDPAAPPRGCAFHPRCPHVLERCHLDAPELRPVDDGQVACHLWDPGRDRTADTGQGFPVLPPLPAASDRPGAGVPLVQVDELSVTFRMRRRHEVAALRGISVALHRGEALGLLGRSGSGKSTLLRCVLGLQPPSGGQVTVDGQDPAALSPKALRALRRRIGFVGQDPFDTLHPAWSVERLVAEPLRVVGAQPDTARVGVALDRAGLPSTSDFLARIPAELSGGQRQRVALARALVTEPAVVLADEPTSMLDVSIRAGIATTLRSLCDDGVAVLLVTHDIAEAAHVCDRLAVLDDGALVEHGPADRVIAAPTAVATRELLAATPAELGSAPPDRLSPVSWAAGD
ncbi:MAG: dipeptide ABC transporter ATP-binding protein [Actinomycetota bacterium]